MHTINANKLRWALRSPPFMDPGQGLYHTLAGVELPKTISVGTQRFGLQFQEIEGGRGGGMRCLSIDTGEMVVTILPDRGMGIWKCWRGDLEFGWQSPVVGPVHPSLVPVNDASGIGWLEGFDELLVRCGLHSNGAPEFAENGTVRFPLHGRIANLPAHQLTIEVDIDEGTLDVIGLTSETRFLVYSLELETRYRFRVGSPVVEMSDTIFNRSSRETTAQLLYHINIGTPILGPGSKVHAAYSDLQPRDARAAESTASWSECDGPTAGYTEQVYFLSPRGDGHHWTESMLASQDGANGFAVQFDESTLPCLSIWKNTVAVEDGYVLGIEPGTNFPNTKSIEEIAGRVVRLAGGESRAFRLRLLPLATSAEVSQSENRIRQLQK